MEGSFAFFLSALPLLYFGINLIYYVIIATIIEAFEELEDNINISVGMAILSRVIKWFVIYAMQDVVSKE